MALPSRTLSWAWDHSNSKD